MGIQFNLRHSAPTDLQWLFLFNSKETRLLSSAWDIYLKTLVVLFPALSNALHVECMLQITSSILHLLLRAKNSVPCNMCWSIHCGSILLNC